MRGVNHGYKCFCLCDADIKGSFAGEKCITMLLVAWLNNL